jgi:thioredoxin 1
MKPLFIASLIAYSVFAIGCNPPLEENFEPGTQKKYVVYDFWAEWCGPCRAYAPKFERFQAKYTRPNVIFKRINVDEDKATADQFDIHSIPTVVVVADGKEIGRFPGGASESQLRKALK